MLAACVKVLFPNKAQANTTIEYAAQYPQGKGTVDGIKQYASCRSSCVGSLFSATATSDASSASAATNSTGSTTGGIVTASTSSSAVTSSFGLSNTASATGSSASHTGAAGHLQLGVTGAGSLRLVGMG